MDLSDLGVKLYVSEDAGFIFSTVRSNETLHMADIDNFLIKNNKNCNIKQYNLLMNNNQFYKKNTFFKHGNKHIVLDGNNIVTQTERKVIL